ncbi:MAG: hypothetical protein DRI54_01910, partial [Bacteroidetes bacterium]
MKKVAMLFILSAFLIACSNKTDNVEENATTEAVEYQLTQLELADFDASAGEFVDKEVKVLGIVDHVCKHGGKKLFLVNDDGEVHVESDDRFDDELIGSEVMVTGIVREFRVDEGYCLQKEEDNIKNHTEGVDNQDEYEEKMAHIQEYRDEMTEKGVDHLSFYSLE